MCTTSPPPQRWYDPNNGHRAGIDKKARPLPFYEESLKILIKENLLSPDDSDIIVWSPIDYFKSVNPPKKIPNQSLASCFQVQLHNMTNISLL